MGKKAAFIFTAIAALAFLFSAGGQCTFTNPLRPAQSPDPFVTFRDGYYYYLVTTGGGVTVRKSARLQDAGSATGVTVWRAGGEIRNSVWAPELHFISGKWYIYTCGCITDVYDYHNMRMFCLEANTADAQGAYTYRGILLNAAAIDADVRIDSTVSPASLLIAWSQFDPEGQCIYLAPMTNPWTIDTPGVRLSCPDSAWEKKGWNVNEGPAFIKRNASLHIVFSASGCSTPDYCLGRLTCTNGNYLNAASWTKTGPIFRRSDLNGVYGPGHNSFTKSPDGTEDWIVYHAKADTVNTNSDRSTRMQKFTWNADDTPNLGVPVKTGVAIACPSTGGVPVAVAGTAHPARCPGVLLRFASGKLYGEARGFHAHSEVLLSAHDIQGRLVWRKIIGTGSSFEIAGVNDLAGGLCIITAEGKNTRSAGMKVVPFLRVR